MFERAAKRSISGVLAIALMLGGNSCVFPAHKATKPEISWVGTPAVLPAKEAVSLGYLMQYWYAELLFKLGERDFNLGSHWYCDAAPIYTGVVNRDPKGTKLKDAAYAAIVSWEKCLGVSDEGPDAAAEVEALLRKRRQERKAAAGTEGQPEHLFATKPIPETQQKLLEALATYLKFVPDAVESPAIKYRQALVYDEYNRIDQALPIFKALAENCSNSEVALYAANLLLDCLATKINQDKEHANDYIQVMEAQVDKFWAMPQLTNDKAFKNQLSKIKAALLRKSVSPCESRNKVYGVAGALYWPSQVHCACLAQ
jgi:hypothetical protein